MENVNIIQTSMKIDTIDIENHFLILRDAYGYSPHLEREDGTAHGGVLTVTNINGSRYVKDNRGSK